MLVKDWIEQRECLVWYRSKGKGQRLSHCCEFPVSIKGMEISHMIEKNNWQTFPVSKIGPYENFYPLKLQREIWLCWVLGRNHCHLQKSQAWSENVSTVACIWLLDCPHARIQEPGWTSAGGFWHRTKGTSCRGKTVILSALPSNSFLTPVSTTRFKASPVAAQLPQTSAHMQSQSSFANPDSHHPIYCHRMGDLCEGIW